MAETSPMPDRLAHLTDAQRRAIETVDRSVLVSAAAGSGKTTVLAERCAALVCDVPESQRCAIDELLVVTFTDAAAGEMRSRIRSAIRQRSREHPRNEYLQRQLHLLEQASISTIHAFCKTLIQRWFPQAGVDPQATVLAGDEAELLRREVLDALFVDCYGRSDELGRSFQRLVDDYGGGKDRTIGETVLSVHDFVNSLPQPIEWLQRCMAQVDPAAPDGVCHDLDRRQRDRLLRELTLQAEDVERSATTIQQLWPIATNHLEAIEILHEGAIGNEIRALTDVGQQPLGDDRPLH